MVEIYKQKVIVIVTARQQKNSGFRLMK